MINLLKRNLQCFTSCEFNEERSRGIHEKKMEGNKNKKQVTVLDGRNENNPELYKDIADSDIQYT